MINESKYPYDPPEDDEAEYERQMREERRWQSRLKRLRRRYDAIQKLIDGCIPVSTLKGNFTRLELERERAEIGEKIADMEAML